MYSEWSKVEGTKYNVEKNQLSVPNETMLKCVRKSINGFSIFCKRQWDGNGSGYSSKYWVVNTTTKDVYYAGYSGTLTGTSLKEVIQRCNKS